MPTPAPNPRTLANLHADLFELRSYIGGLRSLVSVSRHHESLDLTGIEFDQILGPVEDRLRNCMAAIETPGPSA